MSRLTVLKRKITKLLKIIRHTCSTYERTPGSYVSLGEEDLRNTILAALNGVYTGQVGGETFRLNGKTDISIEFENRAAFVAECKMWTGQSEISKALTQLDSYLTWRDCKTALIFFVRNKDFLSVSDTVNQALLTMGNIRRVQMIDSNEFDCQYISTSSPGRTHRLRVYLFNLYYNGKTKMGSVNAK